MSDMVTALIGARVEVSPDPEVTSEGVDQKLHEGTIVAAFMYPTQHPAWRIPVYQVMLDDRSMVDIVSAGRMKITHIPALEPKIKLKPDAEIGGNA